MDAAAYKERLVKRITRELTAFLDEPPEVQRDVVLWMKHYRPETYRRLCDFLDPDRPVSPSIPKDPQE